MNILNAYCGIGGNRNLWSNEHKITAVENNPDIAKIYQEFYPGDKVIVADAHEYLLKHYKEFDFIWCSPPCPTHSCLVFSNSNMFYDQNRMEYPDMTLYQEIILLKHFSKCKFIVENVKPYYKPLIEAHEIGRYCWWSNFLILPFSKQDTRKHDNIEGNSTVYGVSLSKFNIHNKRRLLRNMVNPELGKHILDCAMGAEIKTEELDLFQGVTE